jgi:S1-C subfamily serine protease
VIDAPSAARFGAVPPATAGLKSRKKPNRPNKHDKSDRSISANQGGILINGLITFDQVAIWRGGVFDLLRRFLRSIHACLKVTGIRAQPAHLGDTSTKGKWSMGQKNRISSMTVWVICIVGAWLALPAQATAGENIAAIRRSVVRVFTVSQTPDYTTPWDPGRSEESMGTGFIISGQRIMTNAHVVSNARFIAIEKEGDSRRFEARVKFVAHDCDLAMLDVSDPGFFEGTSGLPLGGVPNLDSVVTVFGYPIGGDRLSVTRGVVSRIDYQVYSHSGVDSHLAIQIDAAINPGNSGGPVMQDGRVVGIAFQGFSGIVAQNVGYMIPVPVIGRFLKDVADGHYDRYVDLGIEFFPLINPAFRRALGLEPGDFGVMVSEVLQAGAAFGRLQVGDVLLAIDGRPIFSDGRVAMDNDRLLLNEVVERKFKGDAVTLKFLRKTKRMATSFPLTMPWPYLTQAHQYDVQPRFVIFGGLVFQPLSSSFYASLAEKPVILRYYYTQFVSAELYLQHPEVVVISKVLPDPINSYQDRFIDTIIDTINDRKVRTLEDVAAAFDTPEDFYVIRVVGDPQPLVLEAKAVNAARKRILERYRITRERYLGDSIVPPDWSPPKS